MSKNSANPLVSVIITTYRRPKWLSRAINSVLNQTYKNIEVIVVDDNGANTVYRQETEKIMKDFNKFSNVRYIKHEKNLNGAAARNTGIFHAKGELISFLDDDDWYLSDKIYKQAKYLIKHPEYHAVYCGWERDNQIHVYKKKGDLSFEILTGTNPIITNSIMMYKDAAIKCGGWDQKYKRNQEAVFMLRFFAKGYKIGVIEEVLVKFDISDRSNAVDPKTNEKYIDYFLEDQKNVINKCEEKIPNATKIIYSSRYRSVLLNYIKNKDFIGAMRLYVKQLSYIPIRFNIDLVKYIFNRTLKNKN